MCCIAAPAAVCSHAVFPNMSRKYLARPECSDGTAGLAACAATIRIIANAEARILPLYHAISIPGQVKSRYKHSL
jgi:hypothetical protein